MFFECLELPFLLVSFLETIFFAYIPVGCLSLSLICTSSLYIMLTNPLSCLNIENIYFITFYFVYGIFVL